MSKIWPISTDDWPGDEMRLFAAMTEPDADAIVAKLNSNRRVGRAWRVELPIDLIGPDDPLLAAWL